MGSNRRDYSLEQRKKMADSQSNKRDEFHDRRKKRDETEILKNLDEYAKRNSQLEPLEPPRNVLQSKLTRYEKESLGWLVRMDTSDELPPLWEEKKGMFVGDFDKQKTDLRPKRFQGGMYAAHGLGKVVTLISLTACDKQVTSYNLRSRLGEDSRKTTLLLCRADLILHWVNNLKENIIPGTLSVYHYLALREIPTADTLMQNDIVLTSYNEFLSPACILRKMGWRRVILDDPDYIGNLKTETLKSVLDLKAKKRWIVVRDDICLGTFLKFLKFEPFMSDNFWKKWVEIPMFSGEPEGMARYQAVLKSISLIREEELPPQFKLENYFVELSPKEREIHDAFLANRRLLFPHTRICSHPNLLPEHMKNKLPSNNIQDVAEKPELQEKLGNEEALCAVRLSGIPNSEKAITKCKHIFCRFCILQCLRKHCCPLCRNEITSSDLYAHPENPENGESASSKVQALLQLLDRDGIDNKSVVFSIFKEALRNLQEPLGKANYQTLMLSGNMKELQIYTVLRQFNKVSNIRTVLLVQLKPHIRLDLIAATRVYFLEPLELKDEQRAVRCVHRLGQKREVKVVRLIAQNTVEDPISVPERAED